MNGQVGQEELRGEKGQEERLSADPPSDGFERRGQIAGLREGAASQGKAESRDRTVTPETPTEPRRHLQWEEADPRPAAQQRSNPTCVGKRTRSLIV